MDKSLGQILIGAVLGAAAVEMLREKKPEVFDEIKNNAKDITKDIKSIYSKIRTTAKDWAQNPS
ncbi:MAG: hypothetical protein GY774_02675 [Planctomycetes bacterium]|nr:hypothetical protein [Planctomycetota bacterium]